MNELYQHNPTYAEPQKSDVLSALFRPRTLIGLVFVWLAIVVGGSGLAIYATQQSLMTDAEVDALLSENERLALTANVAFAQGSTTERGNEEATALVPVESVAVFPDRLTVPSLGIDLPISNPQTRDIVALDKALETAVVRYPDSATLGEHNGNTLIFGHSSYLPVVRNKFFKAFNEIQDLNVGAVLVAHAGRDTYHYEVSRVFRADASDDRIPLQTNGHQLTLLTCDSFGKKSDRWVVEARFVGKNL